MRSNHLTDGAMPGGNIAAALRTLPQKSAPEGGWKRVLGRREAMRRPEIRRRRYWGGGLAVAAGLAVAVIVVRLGAGMFEGLPAGEGIDGAVAASAAAAGNSQPPEDASAFAPINPAAGFADMDLEALIALSQYHEERLRGLPVAGLARPGQVLEVDAFGLATELEDQIALLDEELIPASLNSVDPSIPRSLLRERALLMDDLFSLRRAEASRAGYFHADF